MKLKKDITFIYTDSAEKAMFTPLYEEALSRGYKAKLTDNVFEKCHIGFYCQHTNFPQYSRFSFILLHDIIQGYGNWPDIWFREPWDKYNIGILPSNQWVENWNKCSHIYYARPKNAMFKVGWPKADVMKTLKLNTAYRDEIFEQHGLDKNMPTVLYAPAWENDGKQDDFVKAMLPLGVNILIKQWDADPEKYPEVVKNIDEMEALHKDIKGVTVLPRSTNIFNAIAVSDILVSEESSTMAEAVMMGVPAISVSNWLIPDVTPSRFPECNYTFVTMTKKENLTDCVKNILANYAAEKAKTEKAAAENFSNIGVSSKMIMDIVDDLVAGTPVRYEAVPPQKKRSIPMGQFFKHNLLCFAREIYANYRVRYKFVAALWNFARKFKR